MVNESTVALVQIKPAAETEVIPLYEEGERLLEYAKARTIASVEDLDPVTNDLALITKFSKAMEARRKEYLAPLQSQVKTINDCFKVLMSPIEEADKITRGKILTFNAEQEKLRREQEEINRLRMEAAQKEAALHDGELTEPVNLVEVMPEAPKRTRTELGTVGTMKRPKWELMDFALLPDRFKMENATLIGKVVRAGEREIPGIHIWEEDTIKVNAK